MKKAGSLEALKKTNAFREERKTNIPPSRKRKSIGKKNMNIILINLGNIYKIIPGSSVNFVKFKTEFSDVVEINEIMVTSLCPNAPSQPTRWPARGDQS